MSRLPLALVAVLGLAMLAALVSRQAPAPAPSSDGGDKAAESAYGKLPLSFVPNKGQVESRARFHAQAPGLGVFFGDDEVTLALQKEKKGHALELRFPGANPGAVPEALDRRAGKVNYMTGSDRSKWQTDISTYGAVRYRSLWPGIDLTFKGTPGALKYELTVHPGANPNDIRLAYAGASGLSVTDHGALNVATPLGALTDQRPKTFQRSPSGATPVRSSYALHGDNAYGFKLGRYDRSRSLVIDPGLAYSTFLRRGISHAVDVDAQGNAYVTGGFNVPPTPGAFDTSPPGFISVSKLNSAGTAIVYSTYLSGSNNSFDSSYAISVDAAGNAYVAGSAHSSDFPTTPGAFDSTRSGLSDAFVAKLNPSGSALLYSTLLGGNDFDTALGLVIDDGGNAYLTGGSQSIDFPTTPGAYDSTRGGSGDGFVTKVNPTGTGLVYSTLLGGSDVVIEAGSAIDIDNEGNAYVTGSTQSADFPTTPGAFDTTLNGGEDAFVTKVNQGGSGLVYSTFLGNASPTAAASDTSSGIAVDDARSAYVVGRTEGPNFPTTPGAFDTTFNGGLADVFVSKLNPSGNGLVYSTLVGGSEDDGGAALDIDGRGSAFIIGTTDSTDFPTTPNAHDTSHNQNDDVLVGQLTPSGDALAYSTYLGGTSDGMHAFGWDRGWSLVLGDDGRPYVVGETESRDYPTTPGAFETTFDDTGTGSNAFLTKLDLAAPYDTPASASPLQFSLVPELRQTISASQCQARGGIVSSHGPPLSFTSCNPPAFVPGTAARFRGTGNASLTVVEGSLATPADEADVAIIASLTDVRAAAGGDYAPDPTNPDLTLVARLRISDTHNGTGLSNPGTVADLEFPTPVNCTTTPDPSVGSICAVSTTADAVNPGSILEGRSTVVQTFRVRVNDSGPNGIRGDSDDRRLASQGIYIP